MKKMKTFIFIICAALMLALLALPACAAETDAAPGTAPEGGAYQTVFTRIGEFAAEYKQELLEAASAAAMIATSVIVGARNGKKTKEIGSAVAGVKSDTDRNLTSQNDVVNAVNGLIDGYNGMTRENAELRAELIREYGDCVADLEGKYAELARGYSELRASYERYGETENDRNRVTGAVLAQSSAILEILQLVYANSKNMPQGVKDLVNLKYANTLKTLGDDEQLLAIVEAVRANISAGAKEVSGND